MKKAALGFLVFFVVFCAYVSMQKNTFHYERSGLIESPAEKIFPYISQFKMGHLWSPYEKKDPQMKKFFSGNEGEIGSMLEFDGNSEAGSGSLKIINLIPNKLVEINLIMTKPVSANHIVHYQLTPEGMGTRFTWSMSGENGFLGKLINVFIDCEKMVTADFETGIKNLKELIESQK